MSDTIDVHISFGHTVTFVKLRFGPNDEEITTEKAYPNITKASFCRLAEVLNYEMDGVLFGPNGINVFV